MIQLRKRVLVVLFATGTLGAAHAEPYLAVQAGVKCIACHTNPTGGGKRNQFGNIYGSTVMSARPPTEVWDGRLGDKVGLGGDMRAELRSVDIPNQDDELAFELEETLLYFELNLLPNATFYVDQHISPGSATNRETYMLYWLRPDTFYVKAGRMFLPYGLRLEDDSAFIRQIPGINYTTPDTGVEIGLEADAWSSSLALSNGTAGGAEPDTGKQVSFIVSYNTSTWRVGGSLNVNSTDDGDREMANIFAGLKTGPVVWLVEADMINDGTLAGSDREQFATFLEANWNFRKGHNLKFTSEYLEPDEDVSEDERTRLSVVWEYVPIQFTQVSVGMRSNDGIPQNDLQNSTSAFIQLHNYF